MKRKQLFGCCVTVFLVGVVAVIGDLQRAQADSTIPNVVGTWSGENLKLSDRKGFTSVEKTIHITKQKDRRFLGYFDYQTAREMVRKNFYGIIYPDNKTFSWVAKDSKGYVHGRIHGEGRISVCYIETGPAATVGCADMRRGAQQ